MFKSYVIQIVQHWPSKKKCDVAAYTHLLINRVAVRHFIVKGSNVLLIEMPIYTRDKDDIKIKL